MTRRKQVKKPSATKRKRAARSVRGQAPAAQLQAQLATALEGVRAVAQMPASVFVLRMIGGPDFRTSDPAELADFVRKPEVCPSRLIECYPLADHPEVELWRDTPVAGSCREYVDRFLLKKPESFPVVPIHPRPDVGHLPADDLAEFVGSFHLVLRFTTSTTKVSKFQVMKPWDSVPGVAREFKRRRRKLTGVFQLVNRTPIRWALLWEPSKASPDFFTWMTVKNPIVLAEDGSRVPLKIPKAGKVKPAEDVLRDAMRQKSEKSIVERFDAERAAGRRKR